MAESDMPIPASTAANAHARRVPNARLLLKDAQAGLSYREIAEAHGLKSAEHAEMLVTGLLHRWVPATSEEAVRVEQERIKRLIRVADRLGRRSTQTAAASTRSLRLGLRLHRMLEQLDAGRPKRSWFADPSLSALGLQPDWTPEYRNKFLAALEEMGVSEKDRAYAAEAMEAAASAPPPDRYLTEGDRQRAAAMTRLKRLAPLERSLKRSIRGGGACDGLAGLVELERARMATLGLLPGRRR